MPHLFGNKKYEMKKWMYFEPGDLTGLVEQVESGTFTSTFILIFLTPNVRVIFKKTIVSIFQI